MFSKKDMLETARKLDGSLPEKTLDYEKVVEYWVGEEIMSPLNSVAIWCPGNGTDSIYDAISLCLLTQPKELNIFLSDRTPAAVRLWVRGLNTLGLKTEVFYCMDSSRDVRVGKLASINHLDHTIVYGSDVTCKYVLGHLQSNVERTVHGSRTSFSVLFETPSKPQELYGFFRDALDAGGEGCLNSSVIYADLSLLESDWVSAAYLEALVDSDIEYETNLADFKLPEILLVQKKAIEITEKTGISVELLEGLLMIRPSITPPYLGVGRGSCVVVDTKTPLETATEELGSLKGKLSSVTVDRNPTQEEFEALVSLGVSRVDLGGLAQKPNHTWSHDGKSLIPKTFNLVSKAVK